MNIQRMIEGRLEQENAKVKHRCRIGFAVLFFAFITQSAAAQDNLNAKYQLAKNFEQMGELQKAQAMYEELLRAQPENYTFLESLNGNYLAQKKFDLSIALLLERAKKNRGDLNLWGLLGKSYCLKGDERGAFKLWDDFIARNNSRPQLFRSVASFCIEVRTFEKAIEYLQKGKKAGGDSFLFNTELANLYCLTMNYKAAAESFIEMLNTSADQAMTIEGKMMAYYGKPDALKSFIAGFENADNPTNQMQVLLAKLYLENKDYEKAYKLYQALDKAQGKEGTELLNFGLQLMQAGQSGLAVDVFEYILACYPKTTTANIVKLNLGKALEADADKKAEIKKEQWKPLTVKGNAEFSEYDRAINAYKELIRTYPHAEPSVEGIFRIGKINSDAGFTDSAKLCFKAVIKNYSVSKFAQLSSFELSDIYIRENKLDSAKALLERILTLPYSSQQDKNNARYQLAAISFYTGDFEQARTHYDLILQQPDDDFTNDALELSTLLNTTMNDSALVAKFAEILLKIAQGEFQGLDAQLATVCSAKNQFYVKSLAEEKRIELRIALNDYGEAIALINSVVKEKSNIFEDRLYYCLARIYQFGLKDSVQAGRTYEKFLEAYPNSLFSEKVRDAIKEMQKNL